MSVTADFQAQFEALVTGLTEGETAFVRSEIETSTVEFLKNVFTSLAGVLNSMSKTAKVIQYPPNAFGYGGKSSPISPRWQIRKNKDFNKPPLTDEPYLFRWQNEIDGPRKETSLVNLLTRLGGDDDVGAELYTGLGGLTLSPIASGAKSLKSGLRVSGWTGKAYNPKTKEYVSWKDAVDPAVNHYLRQGALQAKNGVKIRTDNRVTVEGRSGWISIQRAVVEGLVSAGISVSYLAKLNTFTGANSTYDDLADLMGELGILTEKENFKIGFLHKYNHAILLPYFGGLLAGTGKDSLTGYLQREGVL